MADQGPDASGGEPREAAASDASEASEEVMASLPRFGMVAPALVPILLLLSTALGGLLVGSGVLVPLGGVLTVVAIGIVVFLLALPVSTVRFGPDGVRAKQAMRREVWVEWNAVLGVRGVRHLGVIDLLVVDVHPAWWNRPGVRRWNWRGRYSSAITLGLSHVRLSEVLVEVGGRAPGWVRIRPPQRRVSAVGSFVVALVASLLCGLVLSSQLATQLANRRPPETAPAGLPYAADNCGGLDAKTVRRLVPRGRPHTDVANNGTDSAQERSCELQLSAPDRAGRPSKRWPDADLTVSVVRYGSTYLRSAKDEGRDSYRLKQEQTSEGHDRLARLPGLGDAAFVVRRDTGLPDAGDATVHVRRGSDRVSVSYSGQPVEPKRVADAAIVVARGVLEGLPR